MNMSRLLKFGTTTVAMAGALLLSPSPARAALVIGFDDVTLHGGVISGVIGLNTAVTGTNILFDFITLEDTGGGGTLASVQCGLTANSPATSCVLNFDTTTNTFTIVALGGLYDAGPDNVPFSGDEPGTQILAPGESVLTGTFSPNGVGISSAFLGGTFNGFGTDTKAAELLDFFNVFVIGDFSFTNTEILLDSTLVCTGLTCTGNVQNADLDNSGDIHLIPEPGMLTLFGLGLLGIGRRMSRRRV